MLKNFLIKQFIKSKMKGVPEADIDRIIDIVDKNPDFFKQMGEKLQNLTKNGMSQEEAMMKIMKENETEFRKIANK